MRFYGLQARGSPGSGLCGVDPTTMIYLFIYLLFGI